MTEQITVTITWPDGCDSKESMKEMIDAAGLTSRDPEAKSLLSAKMRFDGGNKEFVLSAEGPGEGEYLSPELFSFIFKYVNTGELVVPPELECDDAERALEFFGFPGCTITVSDDDPYCMGKRLAYKLYNDSMLAVPKLVKLVKDALIKEMGGAGMHMIVDNTAPRMNQFAEHIDLVLDHYSPYQMPSGTRVTRFGDPYGAGLRTSEVFRLLSSDDKTASALRQKVCAEAVALGGIKAEWKEESVHVADIGEFGQHDFRSAKRWVLCITLDYNRGSNEGIKRRKIEA